MANASIEKASKTSGYRICAILKLGDPSKKSSKNTTEYLELNISSMINNITWRYSNYELLPTVWVSFSLPYQAIPYLVNFYELDLTLYNAFGANGTNINEVINMELVGFPMNVPKMPVSNDDTTGNQNGFISLNNIEFLPKDLHSFMSKEYAVALSGNIVNCFKAIYKIPVEGTSVKLIMGEDISNKTSLNIVSPYNKFSGHVHILTDIYGYESRGDRLLFSDMNNVYIGSTNDQFSEIYKKPLTLYYGMTFASMVEKKYSVKDSCYWCQSGPGSISTGHSLLPYTIGKKPKIVEYPIDKLYDVNEVDIKKEIKKEVNNTTDVSFDFYDRYNSQQKIITTGDTAISRLESIKHSASGALSSVFMIQNVFKINDFVIGRTVKLDTTDATLSNYNTTGYIDSISFNFSPLGNSGTEWVGFVSLSIRMASNDVKKR